MGGPTSGYHINYARLKLQKKEYKEAENSLDEALQFDYQVLDIVCKLLESEQQSMKINVQIEDVL